MSKNIKLGNDTLNGVETIEVPLASDVTQTATFIEGASGPSVGDGYTVSINFEKGGGCIVLGTYIEKSQYHERPDDEGKYGWHFISGASNYCDIENASLILFISNRNWETITSDRVKTYDGVSIALNNIANNLNKLCYITGNVTLEATD